MCKIINIFLLLSNLQIKFFILLLIVTKPPRALVRWYAYRHCDGKPSASFHNQLRTAVLLLKTVKVKSYICTTSCNRYFSHDINILTSSDSDRSTFPLASSSNWLWRDCIASKPRRSCEAIVIQARSSLQVSAAGIMKLKYVKCSIAVSVYNSCDSKEQLTGFVSHRLGQSIGEGSGKRCYLGMWGARGTGLKGRGGIERPASGRYRIE